MRKKQVIKVCLVLCCTTGMALGQPYSWTGASGFNNLWGNSFNWDCLGFCFCHQGNCGFPDDRGDDAGFRTDPTPDSAWEVDFQIGVITIDDLDISYSVNFNGPSDGLAELHVDSITIGGGGNVIVTPVGSIKVRAQ